MFQGNILVITCKILIFPGEDSLFNRNMQDTNLSRGYATVPGEFPSYYLKVTCYSMGRFTLSVKCYILKVLLALRLPLLGNRELILVLFIRLFDLCLFRFVSFLLLLVSGKGCGL